MQQSKLKELNSKYNSLFKELGAEKKAEKREIILNLKQSEFENEKNVKFGIANNSFSADLSQYESDKEEILSYCLYHSCKSLKKDLNIDLTINWQQPLLKYAKLSDEAYSFFDFEDYNNFSRWSRYDFVIEMPIVTTEIERNYKYISNFPVLFIECDGESHYAPKVKTDDSNYEYRITKIRDSLKNGIAELWGTEVYRIDVRELKDKYEKAENRKKLIMEEFIKDFNSKVIDGIKAVKSKYHINIDI